MTDVVAGVGIFEGPAMYSANPEFDWDTATEAELVLEASSRKPRICFCGPSESGKDESAHYLAAHTNLTYAGSTSIFLAPFVAEKLGLSVEEAFARRHEDRKFWYDLGNRLRNEDPGVLARKALAAGDILAGFRDREEIHWLKQRNLVDLFVWIDRPVDPDPTQKYGPEECDIVIQNHGTLAEFYPRLRRLALFAGISWRD